MVFVSTEKLTALVKPLGELRGRVRTVVVWGAGDAEAASVRAPRLLPGAEAVGTLHSVSQQPGAIRVASTKGSLAVVTVRSVSQAPGAMRVASSWKAV